MATPPCAHRALTCLSSPFLQRARTTGAPGKMVVTDRHSSSWRICWVYVKAHIWRGRGQKVLIRILGSLVGHSRDCVIISAALYKALGVPAEIDGQQSHLGKRDSIARESQVTAPLKSPSPHLRRGLAWAHRPPLGCAGNSGLEVGKPGQHTSLAVWSCFFVWIHVCSPREHHDQLPGRSPLAVFRISLL